MFRCFVSAGRFLCGLCFLIFLLHCELLAQARKDIVSPFDYGFFVENKGQYDYLSKVIGEKIFFYTKISGTEIYFLQSGFLIRKYVSNSTEKEDVCEGNSFYTDSHKQIKISFIKSMNPAVIKGINKEKFYFTFPNPQDKYSYGIAVPVFKSIIYSDKLTAVDLEIKVETLGGNLSVELIKNKNINHEAYNLSLKNASFNRISSKELEISNNNVKINLSENTILNDSVEFKILQLEKNSKSPDKNQSNLCKINLNLGINSNGSPYDVDYDDSGNVYVYGGTFPYEERKYDSSGNLLWVHVTSLFGPYTYYGDFAISRKSGSSYIIECWNFAARVVKLNSNGIQIGYYGGSNQMQEMYRVQLNECIGKLIIAGGAQPTNVAIIDTNFINPQYINFFSNSNIGHDFCMLTQDEQGFVYFATTGLQGIPFDNVIVQAPASGILPLNYIVFDNYHFEESGSIEYIYNNNKRAGFNGLVSNNRFLYSFDGSLLQRWEKFTGLRLDSLIVSGIPFRSGGIDANNCGSAFVTKGATVIELDSAFQIIHQYNLPDTAYDLKVSEKGILYVCGKNFISFQQVINYSCSGFIASSSFITCSQNTDVSIFVNGGFPPYSYSWFPSVSTSDTAKNLSPGNYTVIVSDNSCPAKRKSDTIVFTINIPPQLQIISKDTICRGNILLLSSSLQGNLVWSTGDTTSVISLKPDSSLQLILTYEGNDGCKDTALKNIMVLEKPNVVFSGNDSLCAGETTTISASGAEFYFWNTGEVGEEISVTPDQSCFYYALASNGSCINLDSFFIYVAQSPKVNLYLRHQDGLNYTIEAFGESFYRWIKGNGITCDTCKLLSLIIEKTDTFCIESVNQFGCKDSSCLTIHVSSLYIPDSFTPNGDGLNDFFLPITREIEKYSLSIFNRWGENFFETNQEHIGWDGNYFGKPMPDDVYIYMIKYCNKGETTIHTKTGKLTLIR